MNSNELLLWLSATGEGTWSRYRAALDELAAADKSTDSMEDAGEGVPEAGNLPQHLRFKLNLERLGHTEFFRRDFPKGWRVVPPTIVVMPNDELIRGVLCGARTDRLLSNLSQLLGEENVIRTSQEECPDRVVVQADTLHDLVSVASQGKLILDGGAIKQLLATIPPIDNNQMRMAAELPFGEDWQVKRFSASNLKWTESSISEARSQVFGLFQVRVRFRPEYFMKLQGRSYKLPVQVGKYFVLRRAHRKVLRYDYERCVLSMPVVCRPPLLLDRALTLCTGLIPEIVNGCLEYPCIEPRHFTSAKRILRQ